MINKDQLVNTFNAQIQKISMELATLKELFRDDLK